MSPPSASGPGRAVLAEWALSDRGEIVRFSRGTFSSRDLAAIIARYGSGTQETLPQYTVCWIPGGDDGDRYLAVAIHELADSRPEADDGRARAADGREIEYTRLFCVSYSEMAAQRVSYTELVDSVLGCQLTARSADPVTIELLNPEAPPLTKLVSALAENAAALLLTNRPVCVLGAEQVSARERLQFIEQVMSLLPYGLRSHMSASTWATITARELRLRLFFAGAERDDGGVTFHLTWGRPERLDVSKPEHRALRGYLEWQAGAGPATAAELAAQSEPVRFDRDEIRAMIARLPGGDRPFSRVLEELAEGLRRGQLTTVSASVKRLRQDGSRPEERVRHRKEIMRLGLLREHPGLHQRTAASLYRALLGIAVGPRASYADFCYVEDCAGGRLTGALGREMLRLEFESFVPWLLVGRAVTQRSDEEVMAALLEQGHRPADLITELSRRVSDMRPRHRAHVFDFALRYLYDFDENARAELARYGYLGGLLEATFPRDQDAQQARLRDMLSFVYGRRLTEEEGAELLAQLGVRRTAMLEAVVAEQTDRRSRPAEAAPPRVLTRIARLLNELGQPSSRPRRNR